MFETRKFVHDFFDRNLFERVIIYIFLSDLLVQLIFEVGLGQNALNQGQNKQWAFYLMLALDYFVSVKKVSNIRFTVNVTSCMAFVFFIMVAHGLFMGLILGNRIFTVVNDTVPLLMIGMNILRFQSQEEYKPIDMKFLLYACGTMVVFSGVAGFIAGHILHRSGAGVMQLKIFLPLFCATLFAFKKFPWWIAVAVTILLVLSIDDINRTIMAFLAIVLTAYLLFNVVKYPVRGLIISIILVLGLAVAITIVPEGSKTYNRVVGLADVDLSESKGSIGERQEEWRAINKKYKQVGSTVEFFGLGFGGVYEVARTHFYLKDYGHAHYSWAWFKLRFGQMGYLYLFIFLSVLVYNGFVWGVRLDSIGLFMLFLCLTSVLYSVTYVNAAFLMMGIQFAYHRSDAIFHHENAENDQLT